MEPVKKNKVLFVIYYSRGFASNTSNKDITPPLTFSFYHTQPSPFITVSSRVAATKIRGNITSISVHVTEITLLEAYTECLAIASS